MVASYCMQLVAVANAICLQNETGFFQNILRGDTFFGPKIKKGKAFMRTLDGKMPRCGSLRPCFNPLNVTPLAIF